MIIAVYDIDISMMVFRCCFASLLAGILLNSTTVLFDKIFPKTYLYCLWGTSPHPDYSLFYIQVVVMWYHNASLFNKATHILG